MFLWGLCSHFFALYTQGENTGSYSNLIFNVLRNYQIVFQSGCIILHSPFTFSTMYKFQFLHILTNICYHLILASWWVWSGISLWFWSTFSCWLMTLNIFSCIYGLFSFLASRVLKLMKGCRQVRVVDWSQLTWAMGIQTQWAVPTTLLVSYGRCGMIWCGVVWRGMVCSVAWCGVYGVVWYDMVWYDMDSVVWWGIMWCSVVWYVQNSSLQPQCSWSSQHSEQKCSDLGSSSFWAQLITELLPKDSAYFLQSETDNTQNHTDPGNLTKSNKSQNAASWEILTAAVSSSDMGFVRKRRGWSREMIPAPEH